MTAQSASAAIRNIPYRLKLRKYLYGLKEFCQHFYNDHQYDDHAGKRCHHSHFVFAGFDQNLIEQRNADSNAGNLKIMVTLKFSISSLIK